MAITAAELSIKVDADTSAAEKGLDGVEKATSGLGKTLGDVGKTAAGFALGAGITQAPAFLFDAAKAAADDAASMAQLEQAVTNAEGSYAAHAEAINAAIAAGQAKAFSDDESRAALAVLTAQLGDADEAMSRLSLAQDLARGTGMSLEAAAKLLGKTSDENTNTLKKYGVTLGENATAQDVMNAVDQKFGGQAAAFAESGAGQFAIMNDQLGEAKEALGAQLLPVLVAFTGLMTATLIPALNAVVASFAPLGAIVGSFVEAIGGATPILIALAPVLVAIGAAVLASVVPAMITWVTTTYAQVVAMTLLNASLLPIIAIALAIGVAIAALYLAWSTNFLGIQEITASVVDAVVAAFNWVVSALSTALDAILSAWNAAWPVMQAVIETVWAAISAAVTTYITVVRTVIEAALGVIQAIWNAVWPVLQAVVEAVWPVIAAVVGTYIAAAQAAIETGLAAMQAIWNAVWPVMQAVIEAVWPVIASVVTTYIGAAQAAISTAIDVIRGVWAFWQEAQTTIETVWAAISSTVSAAATAIAGFIGTMKDAVITHIGGMVSSVQGFIEDMVTTVTGFFQTLYDDVTGKVGELVDEAVRLIGALPGEALAALGDLSTTLYSAGVDLIQGLTQGIIDTAKAAIDAVVGVVGGIVDAAKGAAGIHSPSTVFKEIGSDAILGFIIGMDAEKQAAVSKAAEIAMAVIDVVRAMLALGRDILAAGDQDWSIEDIAFALAKKIELLVQAIESAAQTFSEDGLAAAKRLADAAGPIIGLVSEAIEAFAALVKGDADISIEDIAYRFSKKLELLVQAVQQSALVFKRQGLAAAKRFAEAAGPIVGVVHDAVVAFAVLQRKDSDESIEDIAFRFGKKIELLVQAIEAGAATFKAKGLAAARDFAVTGAAVFDLLKAATDYEGLPQFGKDFRTQIEHFFGHVVLAVKKLLQLGDELGKGLTEATKIARKIQTIIELLTGGVSVGPSGGPATVPGPPPSAAPPGPAPTPVLSPAQTRALAFYNALHNIQGVDPTRYAGAGRPDPQPVAISLYMTPGDPEPVARWLMPSIDRRLVQSIGPAAGDVMAGWS